MLLVHMLSVRMLTYPGAPAAAAALTGRSVAARCPTLLQQGVTCRSCDIAHRLRSAHSWSIVTQPEIAGSAFLK